MMSKMMQGNMAMMVPQMLMMVIIPHFFSGFVLGKIPFPLTPSFKGMLQRGVNLSTLDTAYITSMSWRGSLPRSRARARQRTRGAGTWW